MRLDKLQRLEISLMRKSFEIACKRVGLSTARDTDEITQDHACLASEIQALVEQGYTDVTRIAERAISVLAHRKGMN